MKISLKRDNFYNHIMGLEQAVEKLRTLNVSPKTVTESAEIFRDSVTPDAIGNQVGGRHYSCGTEQFIFFHLEALMEIDPEFKARLLRDAVQKLGNSGIAPKHIQEYFQIGADPGLVFMLKHENDYEHDAKLTFSNRANQYALDKMREWLGFQESQE